MARIDVTQVEGFQELNEKLKQLGDSVKRREILSLQRRLAEPVRKRYAANLPEDSGTLAGSVATKTVPARRSGGNPTIVVRPGRRGRNDGYYKFMVIRKGTKLGPMKPGKKKNKGIRKGFNTVVPDAQDRTLAQMGPGLVREAEEKTAALVQRKIDRLSTI